MIRMMIVDCWLTCSVVRLAGTDANVFVNLFGDRGDSGPLALEKSQLNMNKFERNQKDVFEFQIGEIGELKRIKYALCTFTLTFSSVHPMRIVVASENTHTNLFAFISLTPSTHRVWHDNSGAGAGKYLRILDIERFLLIHYFLYE